MKNCKFSPRHIMALKVGRWLPLFVLIFLASCRKEAEMEPSEVSGTAGWNQMSTSRSSDLETQAVAYAQWVLTKVAPLADSPQAFEDLKTGQYSSAVLLAKLNELGFLDYNDFSSQYAAQSSTLREAIRSGALTQETLINIWKAHEWEITQVLPETANLGGPATPCYDQLIHDLAFVAVEMAIASFSGPWFALAVGAAGIAEAYVGFRDCLNEKYP